MKRFLKLAAVAAASLVVLGCGTLQLNPIVTGTACSTREACLKDLNLPNPEKPEYVFVVEPYTMNERGKAPIGTPAFNSPVYHGDVELCIAKALKDMFGSNIKIFFKEAEAGQPSILIKIDNVVAHGVYPVSLYMKIDYQILSNRKNISLTAKTDTESFWNNDHEARKQYPQVCAILARQVREALEGNGAVTKGKAN